MDFVEFGQKKLDVIAYFYLFASHVSSTCLLLPFFLSIAPKHHLLIPLWVNGLRIELIHMISLSQHLIIIPIFSWSQEHRMLSSFLFIKFIGCPSRSSGDSENPNQAGRHLFLLCIKFNFFFIWGSSRSALWFTCCVLFNGMKDLHSNWFLWTVARILSIHTQVISWCPASQFVLPLEGLWSAEPWTILELKMNYLQKSG